MQHVQIPRNRCLLFARCLNALQCCLLFYLAKEVAAILREILTHSTKKLYDDNTAHLLCSNFWVQPIYQELLHSSSRYNATRTGEKNRPSNGLAQYLRTPSAAQEIETSCFCQIHGLDWRYLLLCGYSAGVVSCPLGCGTAPAATEDSGYSEAVAGGKGQ